VAAEESKPNAKFKWRSLWERSRTPAGLLSVLLFLISRGAEYWDKTKKVLENAPLIGSVLSSCLTQGVLLIAGILPPPRSASGI
jgi:hypothetical protein